uniref:Uncharacterized protein n=1 Tax=Trichobilharzia regenti TaxID=157069 RepID=A0AA85JUT3_TRIRE|nr:unnamed protein product [Trichobilharzia regenti]
MGGIHTKSQQQNLIKTAKEKYSYNFSDAGNRRITNNDYYRQHNCNDFKSNLRDEIVKETIKHISKIEKRNSSQPKFSSNVRMNDIQNPRMSSVLSPLKTDLLKSVDDTGISNNSDILSKMDSSIHKMSIMDKILTKQSCNSIQQIKTDDSRMSSPVVNETENHKTTSSSLVDGNSNELYCGDRSFSRQAHLVEEKSKIPQSSGFGDISKTFTSNNIPPLSTKLNLPEKNKTSFESTPKHSAGVITNKIAYMNPINPSLQSSTNRYLSNKPPTPPKVNMTRNTTPLSQGSHTGVRSSCSTKSPKGSSHQSRANRSTNEHTVKNHLPHKSGYTSRPSSADVWSRRRIESPQSPVTSCKPKRSSSITQQLENEVAQDKSYYVSRIEYTFYINDTESCQRPFYDRRVEAIARASQCSICLHRPQPGSKPIFYKGIRVLPVTIFARTMISLKRCLARLDMQYPYFNVKAFCPPDMY